MTKSIHLILLASLASAAFTLMAADALPLEKPSSTATATGPFRVLIVGDYHAGLSVKHATPALLEAKAIQEVAWDVHQELLADLGKTGRSP